MPVNEIENDVDDDDVFDDESDVEELRTSTSFSMITLEGDDRRRITFVSLLSLLDIVNNWINKYLCGSSPIVWISFVSFSLSFLFSSTPIFVNGREGTSFKGVRTP